MSTFQGLPTALFEFFADLAQDNSKDFWDANRQRWQRDVKAPMSALVDELSTEFGPLRMFRPNRDLRFARDKSPYKLWTGATSTPQATGGIGYYLSVSTTGITTGYGAMRMTADQLRRFRGAIDADISGIRFEELTQELAAQGLPVSPGADQPLKNAPRGWSTDHPRINFLRWKGAAVVQDWPTDTWMHTPQVHERIRDTWAAVEPLRAWLDEHVTQRRHKSQQDHIQPCLTCRHRLSRGMDQRRPRQGDELYDRRRRRACTRERDQRQGGVPGVPRRVHGGHGRVHAARRLR